MRGDDRSSRRDPQEGLGRPLPAAEGVAGPPEADEPQEAQLVGQEHDAAPGIYLSARVERFILERVEAAPGRVTGGLLLGGLYRSRRKPTRRFLVIDGAIESPDLEVTPQSVKFGPRGWQSMERIHQERFPDADVVGWYQVHPGHGSSLSPYEQFVHQTHFGAAWQVALVLDPDSGETAFWTWQEGRLVQAPGFRRFHPSGAAPKAALQAAAGGSASERDGKGQAGVGDARDAHPAEARGTVAAGKHSPAQETVPGRVASSAAPADLAAGEAPGHPHRRLWLTGTGGSAAGRQERAPGAASRMAAANWRQELAAAGEAARVGARLSRRRRRLLRRLRAALYLAAALFLVFAGALAVFRLVRAPGDGTNSVVNLASGPAGPVGSTGSPSAAPGAATPGTAAGAVPVAGGPSQTTISQGPGPFATAIPVLEGGGPGQATRMTGAAGIAGASATSGASGALTGGPSALGGTGSSAGSTAPNRSAGQAGSSGSGGSGVASGAGSWVQGGGVSGQPASSPSPFYYVVQRGDTLWEISRKTLGDPALYRKLAEFNGIADPASIRPGQRLMLPIDPGGTIDLQSGPGAK